jgi:hypothetical protein
VPRRPVPVYDWRDQLRELPHRPVQPVHGADGMLQLPKRPVQPVHGADGMLQLPKRPVAAVLELLRHFVLYVHGHEPARDRFGLVRHRHGGLRQGLLPHLRREMHRLRVHSWLLPGLRVHDDADDGVHRVFGRLLRDDVPGHVLLDGVRQRHLLRGGRVELHELPHRPIQRRHGQVELHFMPRRPVSERGCSDKLQMVPGGLLLSGRHSDVLSLPWWILLPGGLFDLQGLPGRLLLPLVLELL